MFGDPSSRILGGDYIQAVSEIIPSKRKKPGDEGYIAPSNPLGLMYSRTDPQSRIELPGWMGKLQGDPTYDNFMSGLNRMSHMKSVLDQDVVSQKDIDNYLSLTMGKGGVDYTGQTVDPLFTQTGGDGNNYMGYPSYEAWLAAQQQAGSGVSTPEEDTDWKTTAWNFDTTYPYPQYGAKDGGRIPAAFGGIMDTATGRRRYFLGSIKKAFKGVAKAAKKVLKSDIGKMALLAGVGYLGGGGGMPTWMGGKGLGGFKMGTLFSKQNPLLFTGGKFSPWKAIGLTSALPFLGIGTEAKQDTLTDQARRGGSLIDPITGKESTPREMRTTLNTAIEEAGNDPVKLAAIEDAYPYLNLGQYLPYASYGVKDGGRIGYFTGNIVDPEGYNISQREMGILANADPSKEEMIRKFLKRIKHHKPIYPDRILEINRGKRTGAQEGGLMDLGGMEKDYRNNGGFVAIGGEERADDVPARLSRNEFVFTADAVRGAGGGDIDKGAEIMENVMKNLEQGGKISEETQGNTGAQEMFSVSERIGEVL